jgi:signal transduction histidine kinase
VLAFGYILLVVIVALTIPLAINLRARARSELEGRALLSAQTIAAGIGKEGLRRGPVLNREVSTYADQVEGRVIVVDADGTILADSSKLAAPGSANYATCGRPEILSALGLSCLDANTGRVGSTTPKTPTPDTTIRYSHTLGADLLAAAAPVLDQGSVFGAVRITQNIAGVNAAVRRVTVAIVLIGLAGLAAGMLVAFALANSLARPLTKLASTAQRIGAGDLAARAGDVGGASEIRALGDSFDEMAGRVERTVRSQREFVANASHQLRTPLTGMKLRLEAAAAQTDDPELKRQIVAADVEVDRLADTVNRMLIMAKGVEEGRATPIDLRDVTDRAVVRWQPRAEKMATSLVAVGDGGRISADPADIDQVIDNLLDNALSHGSGPIRIETSHVDRQARLSVSDRGPGIPAEDQARVTDRFYRGKGTASGGSGLGLAIARELVTKWGGSLDVSNGEDGGARILVRFPSVGPSTPGGRPPTP